MWIHVCSSGCVGLRLRGVVAPKLRGVVRLPGIFRLSPAVAAMELRVWWRVGLSVRGRAVTV